MKKIIVLTYAVALCSCVKLCSCTKVYAQAGCRRKVSLGLALLVFLFHFGSLRAQVTIGSENLPARGALLDLKENEATDGGKTSTKGIVFPRVELTSLTSLTPLLNATDAANAMQKTIHKGIVVYNLKVSVPDNLQEGLYCWDGSQWFNLRLESGNSWSTLGNAGTSSANYMGTSDAADLSIRTDGVDRIHIAKTTGNVGIGTAQPEVNLHVDGKMRLTDVPIMENGANMMIDDNGNIGKYRSVSGFRFGDIYESVMNAPVTNQAQTAANNSTKFPLNVEIEVETPAKTECIYFVDYNVPCFYNYQNNVNIGYIGITFFRDNDELAEGSRKFTAYSRLGISATAIGMPILGKVVDKVSNNGTNPVKTKYKLYGYIEANITGTTVSFGMYSATGTNYNWGKGTMTISSYIKSLR